MWAMTAPMRPSERDRRRVGLSAHSAATTLVAQALERNWAAAHHAMAPARGSAATNSATIASEGDHQVRDPRRASTKLKGSAGTASASRLSVVGVIHHAWDQSSSSEPGRGTRPPPTKNGLPHQRPCVRPAMTASAATVQGKAGRNDGLGTCIAFSSVAAKRDSAAMDRRLQTSPGAIRRESMTSHEVVFDRARAPRARRASGTFPSAHRAAPTSERLRSGCFATVCQRPLTIDHGNAHTMSASNAHVGA